MRVFAYFNPNRDMDDADFNLNRWEWAVVEQEYREVGWNWAPTAPHYCGGRKLIDVRKRDGTISRAHFVDGVYFTIKAFESSLNPEARKIWLKKYKSDKQF